jgi:hypothetical protein
MSEATEAERADEAFVKSKRPGAFMNAHRSCGAGAWKYEVRTGHYPAGELLSDRNHRSAAAAWKRAAYKIKRKMA